MKIFLAQIRNDKNMSIRALSEKSKVAKSHIEKIEAGETNPTIVTMCKLARALGVPITELFSCDD